MSKSGRVYEPPKAKIYRFDNNDPILTDSSGITPSPTPDPTADYAARALNAFMDRTNTTIEK